MNADRSRFAAEYPFDSRFLELPSGHKLHFIDQGRGDVVLFVHGNPTWSFAWRRFVSAISREHRAIAIDHIGCGFSDKPQDYDYRVSTHIENLCEFIRRNELTKITVVAHDWGGAIAMGAAGRMPERFSRFVLMNTGAFHSTSIPFRISLCRIPLLGKLALQGLNAFSRAALFMAVEKPERMNDAVCAGYLAPYDNWANRIAVQRFVADIPLRPGHPSYDTLTEIENGLVQFVNHPMLLMWGTRDWCFTTEFLAEFQRRFPNASTCRIEDAGHYIFEDAHEVAIPRLREFLNTSAQHA
jgi:pimeloyl-ACP methyl ester carboxylesterase